MPYNDVKTPGQLADEFKDVGRAAADSARNIAQASKGIGQEAMHSVKSSAAEARQLGSDTVDTGRAYAKDAVNATGRKIRDLRGQWNVTRERGEQFVAEQPVRATLIAAAAGAVLTALLASALRRPRR